MKGFHKSSEGDTHSPGALPSQRAINRAVKMAHIDRSTDSFRYPPVFARKFPDAEPESVKELYRIYLRVYKNPPVQGKNTSASTASGSKNTRSDELRALAAIDAKKGQLRTITQFSKLGRGKARYYYQYREEFYRLCPAESPAGFSGSSPSSQAPFISTPDLAAAPQRRRITGGAPAAPTGWHRANLSDEVRQRLRQGSRDFNDS